jgi:uncharacterized protein YdcH (DUF465 family)
MSSLVLELQREATTDEVKVTDLLRKAYVVSRKLDLQDFEVWSKKELDGYDPDDELPGYRLVDGEPKVKTNFGTQPLHIPDQDLLEVVSTARVRQPASEVIETVEGAREAGTGTLFWSKPQAAQTLAKAMTGHGMPVLACPVSAFAAILDAIRNTILEWSIDLEEDGILGEDMTFSSDEKERVQRSRYSPGNYNINIGEMHGSQIQQAGSGSSLKMSVCKDTTKEIADFLSELKGNISAFDLSEEKEEEVDAEIKTVESQLGSPKPKTSILKSSLQSLKSVLENTAGSAVGAGLVEQIPALLAAIDSSGAA